MDNHRQTVFIVDDDEAVLDALQLLMKSVNLTAKTFNCAQMFLNTYTPDQSGCLILDIHMPNMTGLELQKYLKLKEILLPGDIKEFVAGDIYYWEWRYFNGR